jgi:16S rRNA (cytidine1402-2'-O)-methyltransferase
VPGTLYVVATPIGNLGDLSPRAAEVLRSVHAVAAEDTRRTLKLFAHLGAPPPAMISLPAFDERGRAHQVLARLAAGQDVALCTDAGTPGVSDPGEAVIAAAWDEGARVVPVPGPCAAIAALAASGLPASRFLFVGFLPRKGGARAEALADAARVRATLVLYEAGNRLAQTLEDLRAALGDRRALVARELTKLHEEVWRGTLDGAVRRCEEVEPRGELVVIVDGAPALAAATDDDLRAALTRLLDDGATTRDAVAEVASSFEVSKRRVYDLATERP